MDALELRLCLAGLGMFVFGLALGFALKAFANPRAALSAHLNAVQSGTFLIVLGLLWPRLAVWPKLSDPINHLVWVTFWALEIGMVLNACAPVGPATERDRPIRLAAAGLMGLSGVGMFVGLGALLFAFPHPPAAAVNAERPAAAENRV